MHFQNRRLATILLLVLLEAGAVSAIELEQFAGAAHAYPGMLDLAEKKLANGELTQEVEAGVLRIPDFLRLGRGRSD